MTNADKIRQMTDEEIADLFVETHDTKHYLACPVKFNIGCAESDCLDCFRKWLKQEAIQ